MARRTYIQEHKPLRPKIAKISSLVPCKSQEHKGQAINLKNIRVRTQGRRGKHKNIDRTLARKSVLENFQKLMQAGWRQP